MQTRIQWVDTDASGHIHFTAAFRLFEAAEAALLARLGLHDETYGKLPRVHATADLKRVLHFYDLVDVHAAVESVGNSSIRYAFEVRREGELCIDGSMVAVLLAVAEGEKVRWSDEQRQLLLEGGPPAGETVL